MSEEDKVVLCKAIEKLDPYWLKMEELYQEGETSIETSESGFAWDVHFLAMYTYMNLVTSRYPAASGSGYSRFDRLSSEGSDRYSFTFSNGIFKVRHESLPMDCPSECPECGENIDFDVSTLTEDNCKGIIHCPECGAEIDLSEWEIEISNKIYDKSEFDPWTLNL